jgi:MHS family shikimate/dehydroshikimate transporter-like MFS transporter
MSAQWSESTTGSQPATVVDRRSSRRAVRATFIGTVLEFYDFTIFAIAAATVFPKVFFAGASPFIATLQSVATFSVAFLVRPLGGAILGSLGDRIGRRRVLVFSLTLMGTATIAIGLIPSRATIGWVAPALLLTMRVLQGIGASGEFSGATLLAVEFARKSRQGLFGSIPAAGNGLGGMLGTLVLLAAQTALPKEQFLAWGWRVPFLLGGVLVGYGLWLRVRLPETPVFRPLKQVGAVAHTPLRDVLRRQPRTLVSLVMIVLPRTGLAYFFLVFLVAYATHQGGLSRNVTLIGLLITYPTFGILCLVFGWLSDIVGRGRVIAGGLLLEVALAFPLFALVRSDWPAGLWLAMFVGNSIAVAAMTAPLGRLMAEFFAVQHRYTGMGLANEVGIAIGGAAIPPLAVYLSFLEGTGTTPLSLLLIGLAVLGLVGLVLLPRTGASLTAPAVTDRTTAPQNSSPPVDSAVIAYESNSIRQ